MSPLVVIVIALTWGLTWAPKHHQPGPPQCQSFESRQDHKGLCQWWEQEQELQKQAKRTGES